MGFGQHTKTDHEGRATGYPVPRSDVKVGRMTKVEVMAKVIDADIIDSKISAHNEVTIRYSGGTVVCRLRETDIVTLGANKIILIDMGGWNTLTTRRHVMNFLKRNGVGISLWGDIKRGGNVLVLPYTNENDRTEIVFKNKVMFNKVGGFVMSDLDNGSGLVLQDGSGS